MPYRSYTGRFINIFLSIYSPSLGPYQQNTSGVHSTTLCVEISSVNSCSSFNMESISDKGLVLFGGVKLNVTLSRSWMG